MIDEKILTILRNNRETYVSSDELCKVGDISRAAIWKHVEKLREEGYDIEASPHLGYRLIAGPDALIPSEIKHGLKTRILGREVISYKKIDSTNTAAYLLAEKGLKEGLVVFAEEQTGGKGRHGRKWVSPPKGGIYFSVLLRPDISPNEIPAITLAAAVAVAKAIRELSGLDAMIKWPNDILIGGKKVCGILTEMKAEQDKADFVIVGIGVNVNTKFKYLPKGATSVREEMGAVDNVSRVELAKKILERLEAEYVLTKDKGFSPVIEEWKSLSAMLGSRIKVSLPSRTCEGIAHDIDPDGALIVRLDSGVLERVSSGDVDITPTR